MLYVSKEGQSIYDVCLQTYGKLEFLLKLVQDNGLNSIGEQFSRKQFFFDESLVKDFNLFNKVSINYITSAGYAGLLTDSGVQIQTDSGVNLFVS